MREFIAKSTGENIFKHTDNVVDNSKKLSNKYSISEKDKSILIHASILHDIGKMTEKMQNFLHEGKQEKFKFTHNIIGWYFITKYVNLEGIDKIANLVLWHHANYNSCSDLTSKLSEIRKEVSSEDLKNMKEFCKNYNIPTYDDEIEESCSDNEFYRLDNLLRSILITADVCASSGDDVLSLFNQEKVEITSLDKSFLNSIRTKDQLQIISKIIEKHTNLIKAPTGFGKSIIGLLFAMLQGKTVLWVCPTNIIASSIYNDVIKALKMMGLNISVELYLTGEVKSSNSNSEEFKSKLIITNIDSFIKPSLSNSYGHRCLMIYECAVIFDEPHEYDKMDCALNAAYNNIMNLRHNVLNSTTINLTATDSPPRFIRVGGKEINYLPNKETHYPAAHKEKYHIHFHDTIPTDLIGEFVFFSHTVDEVQELYSNFYAPKLIAHGRYTDEDKEYKKQLVLDNYGKDCVRQKLSVFTNQILTTACDYSVNTIYLKCPTFRELFQAIGRGNRFGDMGRCDVHIITEKSKADEIHIGSEDENLLQELFINELKNEKYAESTLDELYVFLNQFKEKHKNLINNISRQNLEDSKIMLKYVFPKKNKITKKDVKIANGNKVRHSPIADGIYICAKKSDSEEFVTINFSLNKNIGFTKTFDEDEKTYKHQVKQIKKREGFNKHKKLTPETIIKEAIFYDTPYPVYNHEYNSDIGLFKILKQIK